MTTLMYSLPFALRQLRKSPGFTLTAVLTLAFGIGATTAIFSLVEGVLLRPLPFAQPDRLYVLADELQGVGGGVTGTTAPGTVQYERETQGFTALGSYRQTSFELSDPQIGSAGQPTRIQATRMSAGIFPVLSVQPLLGRVFSQAEDQGGQPVVVLSYRLWNSRFHADPAILGRKLLLDRRPYEIIGVMGRQFEFPLVPGQLYLSALWLPMSFSPAEIGPNEGGNWNYHMVGRLRDGVLPTEAEASAQRVANQIMRGFPPAMASLKIKATVRPLVDGVIGESRPLVRTLFLAVMVVLFIACANLASLLLVRVVRRRREIAVRMALGADGFTILRQNLAESLLLSLFGGVLGLGLAAFALRVGKAFLPESLPRVSSIALDWPVAIFALALALLTGLLCGIVPALAAARTGVHEVLKEGGRTGSAGGNHGRLRGALVVTELAVALMLLVASGLLLRSFQKMQSVDLGFRTDHMLTASFNLPHEQYATQAAIDSFYDRLSQKLHGLPGVQAVGFTSQLPAVGGGGNSSFVAEGYAGANGQEMHLAWPSQIYGNYFAAAGIPLLRGRTLRDSDRAGSPLVAVINRTLAEKYFARADPIGKRLHWGLPETPLPWMTVVGEIADIKETSADAETREEIYQPATQATASLGMFAMPGGLDGTYGSIVLRSSRPPELMADTLRATVRSIDPQLPLTALQTMAEAVQGTQESRRFNAVLLSAFAAAALLLATLGIYSVITFSTAMRAQEMAIRLALGARRIGIVRLILTSGARLGMLGCALGGVAAFFATRLLRSLLFGVSPTDPLVIATATLAVFLLALAASLLPSLRAATIQPVEALRAE